MNFKSIISIVVSFGLAIFFLWLLFYDTSISNLWEHIEHIKLAWIPFFIMFTFCGLWFRALRWRVMTISHIPNAKILPFFTATGLGYVANLFISRIGEISKAIYIAKTYNKSKSTILGTVVLERMVDLGVSVLLMLWAIFFFVADPIILSKYIGEKNMQYIQSFVTLPYILLAIGVICLGGVTAYILLKYLQRIKKQKKLHGIWEKLADIIHDTLDGIFILRNNKCWGRFCLYTIMIWLSYLFSLYSGFWMFDQESHNLGLYTALGTVIAASLGFILPSPGGIGTYHYFIQQFLVIFYSVSLPVASIYAIVTHGFSLLLFIIFSIISLLIHGGKAWNWSILRGKF